MGTDFYVLLKFYYDADKYHTLDFGEKSFIFKDLELAKITLIEKSLSLIRDKSTKYELSRFVESIIELNYRDSRIDIMNEFYEKHCTIKEDLNKYDLPFNISTIDYTKISDDEVFEFIEAIGINFYCIKSGEYIDYLS